MWRGRSERNRGVWVLGRHLWRIIGQDVVVQRRRKAAPAQQSTYIARLQRFVVLCDEFTALHANLELLTHYWLGCMGCHCCSFSAFPPLMHACNSRCTTARYSLLGGVHDLAPRGGRMCHFMYAVLGDLCSTRVLGQGAGAQVHT